MVKRVVVLYLNPVAHLVFCRLFYHYNKALYSLFQININKLQKSTINIYICIVAIKKVHQQSTKCVRFDARVLQNSSFESLSMYINDDISLMEKFLVFSKFKLI